MGDGLSNVRRTKIDRIYGRIYVFITLIWIIALILPVFYTFINSFKSTREMSGYDLVWIPAIPTAMDIAVDYSDYVRQQKTKGISYQNIRKKIADETLAIQAGTFQDLATDQKVGDVAVTAYVDSRAVHRVNQTSKDAALLGKIGYGGYRLTVGVFNFFNNYPGSRAYWTEQDYSTGDSVAIPPSNSKLTQRVQNSIHKLNLRYALDQPVEPLHGRVLSVRERLAPERLLDNYIAAANLASGIPNDPLGLGRFFINSLLVVSLGIFFQCTISGAAGYALSRLFSKRIAKFGLLFVVATLFIPYMVLLIPVYITISMLGLAGTIWGIVFPATAWGLNIFIFKQFFDQLPGELFEAARIDGCNEIKIFTIIVIPISSAVFGVVTLFTFNALWGDFIWQNVAAIGNSKIWTLAVGLTYTVIGQVGQQAGGGGGIGPSYGAAASILAALPTIIVFSALQNSIKKGALLGSVKG